MSQSGLLNIKSLMPATLVVNADSGSASPDVTGNLSLVTGDGLTTTAALNTVTITADNQSDGQLLIGSTIAPRTRIATLGHADGSITVTNGSGTIDLSGTQATTAQKGSVTLASASEALLATDSSKVITPATLNTVMSQMTFTGFQSWAAGGPFFDDTTLGTFTLLVGGTGFIDSKEITWTGPQSVTGLTAGNTYYIYIDSTGTLQKTTTRSDSLYLNNIVLFECLRDSTPVTNNQITVADNHPYNYPTATSNYEHGAIGTVIDNFNNGANITLNGTQKIQINGADILADHGLETIIPDSGGVGVTFHKMYTDAGGKWSTQNVNDTFLGFFNNGGTPTALGATRFAVYTLYASKNNLNTATPLYFAVLNTASFANQAAANTAINNGSIAKSTNELQQLELAQLGFIIYGQTANAITSVIIQKATLRQTISTAGSSTASLINTDTTNFNHILSVTDTTVQQALDTLDDAITPITKGNAGQILTSAGGALYPVWTTAVYPATTGAGEMLLSNAANTVISSASMTGDFTYTSSTAGTERIVTISNTDNTNTASAATQKITTGGASAGDPRLQFSTTTTSWSMGIDNSITSPTADPLVISQGTALGTNNVMSIDTSGSIVTPLQSAFLATVTNDTGSVTGDGTVYTVVFDAEVYDQNSDFDGTSTFTAPATGKYYFSAQVSYSVGATIPNTGNLSLVTSNRTLRFNRSVGNVSIAITSADTWNGSVITDMDIGDTAIVDFTLSGATKVDIVNGATSGAPNTFFSGYLAC